VANPHDDYQQFENPTYPPAETGEATDRRLNSEELAETVARLRKYTVAEEPPATLTALDMARIATIVREAVATQPDEPAACEHGFIGGGTINLGDLEDEDYRDVRINILEEENARLSKRLMQQASLTQVEAQLGIVRGLLRPFQGEDKGGITAVDKAVVESLCHLTSVIGMLAGNQGY
jgi:hypothetical protein